MPPSRPPTSARPGLSPEGTALVKLRGAGAAPRGPRFSAALEARLGALDLPPEVLYLAWELAALAPGLDEGERAALLHLALAALIGVRQGDTRLPVGPDARGVAALEARLGALGLESEAQTAVARLVARARDEHTMGTGASAAHLAAVIGPANARTPLVLDGEHLYIERIFALERRLAAALARRLGGEGTSGAAAPASPDRVAAALADIAARPPIVDGAAAALTEEQARAVAAALGRRLAIVSGGPGTGKTSVVVAVLRALVRVGVDVGEIAIAAPTGKAANRLAQALERGLAPIAARAPEDERLAAAPPVPSTLHRLLGYQPASGRFQFHARRPLPHRFVIVDEASMIDLGLMERLCAAVGDESALLLLGDADQLPSVDAGAVFRDLSPWAQRLTQSFRMSPTRASGRALLEVARAVNSGDAEALLGGATPLVRTCADAAALRWEGVELLETTPAGRAAFLDRWFEEKVHVPGSEAGPLQVPLRLDGGAADAAGGLIAPIDEPRVAALIRHFDRARLLCVTRSAGRPTGAAAVNTELHVRHKARAAESRAAAARFVGGEPLLMLRNDYVRGLFNGDQGLCLPLHAAGVPRLAAVFPRDGGRFVAFPIETMLADLELGYALTVHKAQGSELEEAALILPDEEMPLLSRQILYTGLTRCKRAAAIVGPRAVLLAGVARAVERSSGLARRLGAG